MKLSKAQAQAVADIIIPHADEYYDLVERAQVRFPEHDWVALCLPNWADPRPKPKARTPSAIEAQRRRKAIDAALVQFTEDYGAWTGWWLDAT